MCVFCPQTYNEINHGFIEAGCNVKDFFIDDKYKGKTDILIEELEEAIDNFKPDFIFSYGWWDIELLIKDILDAFKNKGIPHIWWAYDDPICFHAISLPVALESILVFTTVEECIPKYEEFGVKAYLMPHGCSPHYVQVNRKKEYMHDVVMLANNYNLKKESNSQIPFRLMGINDVLKPLVDHNLDVKVWGRWWTDTDRAYNLPKKFYGGIMPAEEGPFVYASTKIVLGLQQVNDSITHISPRTFEALGCGRFHISQYSKSLETFFKKGVHMEWSSSPEETLEIVKYYLLHSEARETIARQGQIEVQKKHTLLQRAKNTLDVIGKFI